MYKLPMLFGKAPSAANLLVDTWLNRAGAKPAGTLDYSDLVKVQ